MTVELPPIERLEAVTVNPGDVVVAHVPSRTTSEQATLIRPLLKGAFPGNEVLIVCDMDLSVMRPDATEAVI